MDWLGHIIRSGKERGTFLIVYEAQQVGRGPPVKPRLIDNINVKENLQKIGQTVDQKDAARGRVKWRGFLIVYKAQQMLYGNRNQQQE